MELNLAKKRVLITGASQGIGKCLALSFAQEGCDMHLVARSADKLKALALHINTASKVNVSYSAIDMTTEGACQQVINEAGHIDILVSNAGVVPSGSLFDISGKKWREGWQLKGFSYVDMIRLVYQQMKAQGGGVIINNIGSGGEVCDANYIEGAACNASLMAMTKALGGCSLDDNIRVVGVNPGPVRTERINKLIEHYNTDSSSTGKESPFAHFPLGRPAEPQEIADLTLFLASPRAGYISGTIVTIDGGISANRKVF